MPGHVLEIPHPEVKGYDIRMEHQSAAEAFTSCSSFMALQCNASYLSLKFGHFPTQVELNSASRSVKQPRFCVVLFLSASDYLQRCGREACKAFEEMRQVQPEQTAICILYM